MKKTTFLLLVLLVILLSDGFARDFFSKTDLDGNKKRFVLMHPTIGNLKNFIRLVEFKIIEVDEIEVVGVYHDKGSYDYDKSAAFLRKNDYPYIYLHEINEELNPDNIFQNNPCSGIFRKIIENSSGTLFLGGPDIPPQVYGEETNLLTVITDPGRHYLELSFLFHMFGGYQDENRKPYLEADPDYIVWGFCLGMQTMNIATGGTLYQDIPTEVYGLSSVEELLKFERNKVHRNYWYELVPDDDLTGANFHQIKLIKDRFFTEKLDFKPDFSPYVYSSHHQGVKKTGKDLVIAATSMDGKIVEAMTHKKFNNVLGVQFHPENSNLYDPDVKCKRTPDDKGYVSLRNVLIEYKSDEFHRKLWKHFSRIANGG